MSEYIISPYPENLLNVLNASIHYFYRLHLSHQPLQIPRDSSLSVCTHQYFYGSFTITRQRLIKVPTVPGVRCTEKQEELLLRFLFMHKLFFLFGHWCVGKKIRIQLLQKVRSRSKLKALSGCSEKVQFVLNLRGKSN